MPLRENKIKLLPSLERYNGIADSRKVKPGTTRGTSASQHYSRSRRARSSDTVASNADTPAAVVSSCCDTRAHAIHVGSIEPAADRLVQWRPPC